MCLCVQTRLLKILSIACLVLAKVLLITNVSFAETDETPSEQKPEVKKVLTSEDRFKIGLNQNNVTILGGDMTGTVTHLLDDISKAVGDSDKLRIISTKGGVVTNIRDILYLKGVDMGIVRSDVIHAYKQEQYFDDNVKKNKAFYRNLSNRLTYISLLHKEEFTLLSSRPEIRSVQDLNGKVVALHTQDSLSGKLLLTALGIRPQSFIEMDFIEAAAKTKKGEVDAILRVVGKPFNGTRKILNIDPNLRIIPIAVPPEFYEGLYFPSKFTHNDYPNMIKPGGVVQTVSVNTVLAAYNWKAGTNRYRRLQKFTDIFFSGFDRIKALKGRHAKWDQVNIAAKISDFKRFKPAEKWLQQNPANPIISEYKAFSISPDMSLAYERFQNFLKIKKANLNQKDSKALFAEFIKWKSSVR